MQTIKHSYFSSLQSAWLKRTENRSWPTEVLLLGWWLCWRIILNASLSGSKHTQSTVALTALSKSNLPHGGQQLLVTCSNGVSRALSNEHYVSRWMTVKLHTAAVSGHNVSNLNSVCSNLFSDSWISTWQMYQCCWSQTVCRHYSQAFGPLLAFSLNAIFHIILCESVWSVETVLTVCAHWIIIYSASFTVKKSGGNLNNAWLSRLSYWNLI